MISCTMLIFGFAVSLVFKKKEPDIALSAILICSLLAAIVAVIEIPTIAIFLSVN